ncbi:MAG: hypothetical protein L0216_11525 [Planctomycetales bacterium]|nr:hypothetical protein [Planctomycetales bacterium]
MRGLEVAGTALAAAAVGAGAALLAGRAAPEPSPPVAAPPSLPARLAEIEGRLAALERGRASPAEAPGPAPPAVAPADRGDASPEPTPGASAARRDAAPAPPAESIAKTVEGLRRRVLALEDGAPEDLSRLDADALAERAREAGEARQKSRALRLWRELLARDPRHREAGEAHFTIGLTTDDADEALSHIRAVIERHPDHGWHRFMRYYLGTAHEMKKDSAAAYEAYEASLGEVGDNPYFNVWARHRMATIAEEGRRDPATAERLRREILERWGASDWPTVASALKETRAKLGIAEPAGK